MSNLVDLRKENFVLWRPKHVNPVPKIIIGELIPGVPNQFNIIQSCDFVPYQNFNDLWVVPVNSLNKIVKDKVYYYFIEIFDSNDYRITKNNDANQVIMITDPLATSVAWNLMSKKLSPPYENSDCDPAGIFKISNNEIIACDSGGEDPKWENEKLHIPALSSNYATVIYEIPCAWANEDISGNKQIDVGTFKDVMSLVSKNDQPVNFTGTPVLENSAHLLDLGINAIEFLPLTDSMDDRGWSYRSTNYFSPEYQFGLNAKQSWSTSITDLVNLVKTCHKEKIRVFLDVAVGYTLQNPYRNLNFSDFLIHFNNTPLDPEQGDRDPWGGDLLKYNYNINGYDPITGSVLNIYPARQLMKLMIQHWIEYFHIDGIRIDSIKTIKNYDFVGEFTQHAKSVWAGKNILPDKCIVAGEVLDSHEEYELIKQNRVDAIWNEQYKQRIRYAILGKNKPGDISFEDTIRKIVDCRNLGYATMLNVINYLGTHDTEGFQNERLYNFLQNNNVNNIEQRTKLAFIILLTSLGIPMIFAGDEFADESDLPTNSNIKQHDPVNYTRMNNPWRKRIFDYVANMIKFRTSYKAFQCNEINFLHFDFNEGKRVVVYERGLKGSNSLAVVVANFSDWGSAPGSTYIIPNWPATPVGKKWKEITQDREVPANWIGKESIYPWEAKVYLIV